jgi:hypothetical protein
MRQSLEQIVCDTRPTRRRGSELGPGIQAANCESCKFLLSLVVDGWAGGKARLPAKRISKIKGVVPNRDPQSMHTSLKFTTPP